MLTGGVVRTVDPKPCRSMPLPRRLRPGRGPEPELYFSPSEASSSSSNDNYGATLCPNCPTCAAVDAVGTLSPKHVGSVCGKHPEILRLSFKCI